MSTIFMNSENSKTSDPHRLLLNLTDKIGLRGKDKYIALSNFSIWIHGKILKSNIRITDIKYQLQHGMKNLNYIMVHILYQILLSWIHIKKAWEKTVNPSVRIYINKIEKRITFQIKRWYYHELLTPETMKLLESTKSKITKNEMILI